MVSQEEASSINSSSVSPNFQTSMPLDPKFQHLSRVSKNPITSPELVANSSTEEPNLNQLVDANNRFGFDLFRQILAQRELSNNNIVVSPNSVAIALAIIRNGTAGETLAEMNTTLALDQFKSENIDQNYTKLVAKLNATDVQLAIANSLWVNQNIALPYLA